MKKITIALLYGGKSAEHEVSLRSARSIYLALDKSRYRIVLIGIDKSGRWRRQEEQQLLKEDSAGKKACVSEEGEEVVLDLNPGSGRFVSLNTGRELDVADAVFPVLHGPLGEDGTVQGVLKLAGLPFVGCGVLSSALCMDKEVAKRLMREAGIPTARFLVFDSPEIDYEGVCRELGNPVFVKPSNMGSSVGIARAADPDSFRKAVATAFRYDRKIIVEEEIKGREVECSVLGNRRPEASVVGEIVPASRHGFYSYEAKYLDQDGAALVIPAGLPRALEQEIRGLATKVYSCLCCEGLARVDFFVREEADGKLRPYVNELNTLPGFTSISMYPKLWEAAGLAYPALLDRLVDLAFERYKEETSLESSAFV